MIPQGISNIIFPDDVANKGNIAKYYRMFEMLLFFTKSTMKLLFILSFSLSFGHIAWNQIPFDHKFDNIHYKKLTLLEAERIHRPRSISYDKIIFEDENGDTFEHISYGSWLPSKLTNKFHAWSKRKQKLLVGFNNFDQVVFVKTLPPYINNFLIDKHDFIENHYKSDSSIPIDRLFFIILSSLPFLYSICYITALRNKNLYLKSLSDLKDINYTAKLNPFSENFLLASLSVLTACIMIDKLLTNQLGLILLVTFSPFIFIFIRNLIKILSAHIKAAKKNITITADRLVIEGPSLDVISWKDLEAIHLEDTSEEKKPLPIISLKLIDGSIYQIDRVERNVSQKDLYRLLIEMKKHSNTNKAT